MPTLKEQGFNGHADRSDLVRHGHAQGAERPHRSAVSAAFEKAFQDKALREQMQKAGEYRAADRAQIEEWCAKQAEVIEKYKDLLG